MGESQGKAGLRLHDFVLALRQHSKQTVSQYPGEDVVQRQPGDVLGTGEVRSQNARHPNRSPPADPENEPGSGRPWRGLRALRSPERSLFRLCVYFDADGDRKLNRVAEIVKQDSSDEYLA